MPDVIQQLPEHVANQIAAGEVVQRPASVVKELLENAVDAGASHIDLIFKDGGKSLIQIIDNGTGMSGRDAALAFNRHATSKIQKAEDLFNIHTKGFRGEALASIAAISHVDLKTRREGDELGSLVRIQGGKVIEQNQTVIPAGTTISVKNLFFNIPARRNFLKSDAVETRHILDEFHRVALAHPGLSFSVRNNDNLLFDLPVSNLRKRIANVFGKKYNEKLVPVSEQTDIVRVSGFVIKPKFARKSRGEQFFFVNDRFIRSSYLHHAVVSGFEGLLADQLKPGYFLYLEVDPTTIDINIHPTKTEIKFENEHAIYSMLRAMIKHALGQFSVAPSLDFDLDSSLDPSYKEQKRMPVPPRIEVDRSFNPFGKGGDRGYSSTGKKRGASWEALYVGVKEQSDELEKERQPAEITIESEEVDGHLFGEETLSKVESLFFQVQNKYIVTPLKGGIVVVHQNLAHRRILYEEILNRMENRNAPVQQLLFPLRVSFDKNDITLLEDMGEQLRYSGLDVTFEDGETIQVNAVPQGLAADAVPGLLHQLVDDVRLELPEAGIDVNQVVARTLARSMAVKTGNSLTVAEQENLLDRLFSCNEPGLSPENKPVMVRLDAADLDKKFA